MKEIYFDFDRIYTMDDFHEMAKKEMSLPAYYGRNLDALWDCITSFIPLPVKIKFINFDETRLNIFYNLILLFEDATEELEDELYFECDYKIQDQDTDTEFYY